MIELLRAYVGPDRGEAIYECRECGTGVDGPDERCPRCGAAVVRYEVG